MRSDDTASNTYKDRSGPPKAFENPDIVAANPLRPRLPLCLLESGVWSLDAARCGFQFALAQPGKFPQPTKQLTVSRFATPQQHDCMSSRSLPLADERATGNNHNTMRKKSRHFPLLPQAPTAPYGHPSYCTLSASCSDILLRPKVTACPAGRAMLHAASHVMPQWRHGPALPLERTNTMREKDRCISQQSKYFLTGEHQANLFVPFYLAINSVDRIRASQHAEFLLSRVAHHIHSFRSLPTPVFDLVPLVATFASSRFACTVPPLSDTPNPKTSHGNYVTTMTSRKPRQLLLSPCILYLKQSSHHRGP
ncbi:hypothetical protein BDP55DRAFT_750149 [Colletotrichum godetiae]|uniref:Uncharacterized protein n=1 Tax=Colletotrichum godetiae TaxID=1209918 RepID=A0AAJ0ESP0_9PEZI|nr:uncharacterized protein BDP55DRAFT_750149 [Colletotrichum godetiae]KAK1672503.1 hypothetical protein BDP55DRAFT_750149 [Colletotrichum godetiae]